MSNFVSTFIFQAVDSTQTSNPPTGNSLIVLDSTNGFYRIDSLGNKFSLETGFQRVGGALVVPTGNTIVGVSSPYGPSVIDPNFNGHAGSIYMGIGSVPTLVGGLTITPTATTLGHSGTTILSAGTGTTVISMRQGSASFTTGLVGGITMQEGVGSSFVDRVSFQAGIVDPFVDRFQGGVTVAPSATTVTHTGTTLFDSPTINVGTSLATNINFGTGSLVGQIIIGNGSNTFTGEARIVAPTTFSSTVVEQHAGLVVAAESTAGSNVGQGYELVGSIVSSQLNTTFNVNALIGSIQQSIIDNSGIVNLVFGSINNPKYSYSGNTTGNTVIGSYNHFQQNGSGISSIGKFYGNFAEYPILLIAPGGQLNGGTYFGFYTPDYSVISITGDPIPASVFWTREQTSMFSGFWNAVWPIYVAGTQNARGTSYIGNRLGVGFVSAPTINSQIEGNLHIGAGSTSVPAIKIDAGTLTSGLVDGALEYDGVQPYFTVGTARKPLGQAYHLLSKMTGVTFGTTADTTVNLIGGSKFIVTDIVVTNPSLSMNTADDAEWWTSPNRNIATGFEIARAGASALSVLVSSTNYINKDTTGSTNVNINATNKTVGNTIYFSLGTIQSGGVATVDMYIYGYILA